MKSKIYFLVNENTKTIEIYHSVTLFSKYLMAGEVQVSDIKEVGNIGFLINKLKQSGVLLFDEVEFQNPRKQIIEVGTTSSVLTFENLNSAIQYCRKVGLSAAADSYIRTTLLKNLHGQTKVAYGKSWSYSYSDLNLSGYEYKIML